VYLVEVVIDSVSNRVSDCNLIVYLIELAIGSVPSISFCEGSGWFMKYSSPTRLFITARIHSTTSSSNMASESCVTLLLLTVPTISSRLQIVRITFFSLGFIFLC